MRRDHLTYLVCPACWDNLEFANVQEEDTAGIATGQLRCLGCGVIYPIIRHVPRFVPEQNYASGFGYQWTAHANTQYDSYTGVPLSEIRFFEETKWPRRLEGEVVLEVGSGSGRFTVHAVGTGAMVISMDYSRAVDVNWSANGSNSNLLILQGDVYRMPFRPGAFDRVCCLGVLQHTPDVRAAFHALTQALRPDGHLAVDVYRKPHGLRRLLATKYWVRPLTRRLPPERLYRLTSAYVRRMWPLARLLGRIPRLGKKLNWALLVADYRGVYPLSEEHLEKWAVLDTFDMLAPAYDNPQTLEVVKDWFQSSGFTGIEVHYGYNGVEGRGRMGPHHPTKQAGGRLVAESSETRTVVVDARMLAYPLTGIGRYVLELLSRLAARPRTHWVMLSAGPVPVALRTQVRGSVEWVEGPASQRAELWTQRIAARELRRRPGATFLGLGNSVPFLGPHRMPCCLVIYDLSFFVVPSLTAVVDLVKAFAVTLPSLWKADRIIAISPQVQSELHRFIRGSKGRTIALPPGGTRLRGGSPESYEERRGFVTVGAHRRKNTNLLLEAYALLPRPVRVEHPLVIVARLLPARLERLVTALGLGADVQLVPDASDAELGRIYGHSRALVYPSAYEGLGLPVAEAILSGLPSIVPRGSPMEHFLAGAGVVVDRLEPSALADAMQALVGDRELWDRCAAAAAYGAEQFSWDRVAEAAARALEV